MSDPSPGSAFIEPDALLEYWQGHRALTRRVIEAFPDEHLFSYSLAGMRPFGEMAREIVNMCAPMLLEVVRGEERAEDDRSPIPKKDLLQSWDDATDLIDELFPQIPANRFSETITVFGHFTDPLHSLVLYVIDNEIHHRAQGYVFLRSLDETPPFFWERKATAMH